jgi:hypothetical protein
MSDDPLAVPVTCNPQALSPESWAEHQATTERLFGELREATEELRDGYELRFPAGAFPLVAAFVEQERHCCPFFSFRLTVPPGEVAITLHITGSPEAKAVIRAELLDWPDAGVRILV